MTTRSLVNETISKLLLYIEKEQLDVGDKLPNEAKLAKQLEVGRSTLREAVRILVFSNVLDVRHGSGTYVKSLNYLGDVSTQQLLMARQLIEVGAIDCLSGKKLEIKGLLQLKELLFQRNRLLESGVFSEYIEKDLAFHQKIVELSNNPFLLKWYEEILPQLQTFLSSQVLKMEDYSDNTALHNALYQALVSGDFATAKVQIITNIEASNLS